MISHDITFLDFCFLSRTPCPPLSLKRGDMPLLNRCVLYLWFSKPYNGLVTNRLGHVSEMQLFKWHVP